MATYSRGSPTTEQGNWEDQPLLDIPDGSLPWAHSSFEQQDLVIDDEIDNEPTIAANPWAQRASQIVSTNFPTLHKRAQRFLIYLRGPLPPKTRRACLNEACCTPEQRSGITALELPWLRFTRRCSSLRFLVVSAIIYTLVFAFLIRKNWYTTSPDSLIGCTSSFWRPHNACGLDGRWCRPFLTEEPSEFRCPASCTTVELANIRAVGAEEIVYRPLVVGGGDINSTYRGDSWVCVAAVHAGVISNEKGGFVSLERVGSFTSFVGTESNGVSSVSFPSIFPSSYRFLPSPLRLPTRGEDLRRPALVLNILATTILFTVLRPSSKFLFWSLVVIGHWHITFFSDPRGAPPPLSNAFGVFLPALFVAYGIWRSSFRHVLPSFEAAPLARALLYLPSFWCGAQWNVIEARLPLDRLTPGDFGRPGAITALVILGCILVVIGLNQARVIRKTGWLPIYLRNYVLGALALLILTQVPGLSLRIHHYFIALMLLPGTAFSTNLSAVYQGFLLGMFLHGESRWGFDSILQTASELRRDAPSYSSLPSFLTNSTHPPSPANPILSWMSISQSNVTSEGWDGFSLIIDDVERYTGELSNMSVSNLDWTIPHFFRLAYQKYGISGDYTRAAILWPNGTWVEPQPGPS